MKSAEFHRSITKNKNGGM